jgi:hypothetical protein
LTTTTVGGSSNSSVVSTVTTWEGVGTVIDWVLDG